MDIKQLFKLLIKMSITMCMIIVYTIYCGMIVENGHYNTRSSITMAMLQCAVKIRCSYI